MTAKKEGRVALITNCSADGGVGGAVARLLLQNGIAVAFCAKDINRVSLLNTELSKLWGPLNVYMLTGDLSDSNVRTKFVGGVIGKYGRLDLLVNVPEPVNPGSAGIGLQLPEFDKIIDKNMRPVIDMIIKCQPHLARTKGSIINISSTGTELRSGRNKTFYNMYKASLDMLTQCLAKDYGAQGVRVNCIHPGLIQDPKAPGGLKTNENVWAKNNVPMGKLGSCKEVAEAVLFLANAADFCTSTVVTVDGGMCV